MVPQLMGSIFCTVCLITDTCYRVSKSKALFHSGHLVTINQGMSSGRLGSLVPGFSPLVYLPTRLDTQLRSSYRNLLSRTHFGRLQVNLVALMAKLPKLMLSWKRLWQLYQRQGSVYSRIKCDVLPNPK